MIRKHAKFQKNPIKDVGGVVDTSFKNYYFSVHKGCNNVRNNWITNSIPYVYPHLKKRRNSSKFQQYPIKDVGGIRGTRCVMDTQTDRMTNRRTRVISVVPPLLHRVTNRKNSYRAFNHL